MTQNITKTNTDLGILLMRVATGGLMLFHGLHKVMNGHDGIRDMLAEKGLPVFLWLGVPVCEVVAPVFLILGVCSRISGLLIAAVMAATFYFLGKRAFGINEYGGVEAELNILFLMSGLALFFTGGGRYVVLPPKNDWTR